jgi:thiol-disulfide isomerase/thioredoxin
MHHCLNCFPENVMMRIRSVTVAALVGFGLAGFIPPNESILHAAPAKPAAKSDSKSTADSETAEIPAVPYLTLALIRDPSIHAELGLTPKQVAAVQAAIAEVDESFWRLRDVPVKKCAAQLDSLLASLRLRSNRDLTPKQIERLDQIILQARGWKALVSPEIAERLKLSPDQVSKLKSALADAIKEREVAEKSIADQSAASQEQVRAKLRKAEAKRFSDVLSAKQQNEFASLLGKSFDLSRVTQVGCMAPELRDVTAWINSEPLTLKQLRGRVVVVHFWAFGCINCIRNLPHYQGWQEKFAKDGVTIIGIQTPETDSERKLDNLKRNVIERKIEYPVVFDGASENWKAWGNNMWPSVYLIDKQGRVRNWWYGELNWEGAKGEEFMRKRIAELLAEK